LRSRRTGKNGLPFDEAQGERKAIEPINPILPFMLSLSKHPIFYAAFGTDAGAFIL
jgi:hypothetical protein